MRAIFETGFDIAYLLTVLALGIRMLKTCGGQRQYRLFGIMAVVLGAGDAFHLVPRAIALCTTGLQDYTAALGIGKLITSLTMTVFYLLLYHVWRERYRVTGETLLTRVMYLLAFARIVLCLMPQNQWLHPQPPVSWGIYRNIPFTLMGLITVILFFRRAKSDPPFRLLWLTIVLSFGFYLPVVLDAGAHPIVGMLMIPKTCAYVWTVLIGWNAMKRDTP